MNTFIPNNPFAQALLKGGQKGDVHVIHFVNIIDNFSDFLLKR